MSLITSFPGLPLSIANGGTATTTGFGTFAGARYTTAAGQSIANDSGYHIIDFGTSAISSSNVTTGASWKYTVGTGEAGKYLVTAIIQYDNLAWVSGNFAIAAIHVNGSAIASGGPVGLSTTATYYVPVAVHGIFNLAVSDTVDVRGLTNRTAGNANLYASSTYNEISIARLS